MNKPRILVLTAAGRTGMPVALQLLDEGFPVTAFTDINDMRTAMAGARRAYFCVPNEAGNLKAAAIFTVVAAEQKLEAVVAMSQWLSNPNHPSVHTREVWLADRLFELLPGTAVTFINPGFFADNEMQVLPFAAQFGLLSLPYGSGLNAPPSNEDMARVVAEILARPEGHAGKTYRPTGPKLLSPQETACLFTTLPSMSNTLSITRRMRLPSMRRRMLFAASLGERRRILRPSQDAMLPPPREPGGASPSSSRSC